MLAGSIRASEGTGAGRAWLRPAGVVMWLAAVLLAVGLTACQREPEAAGGASATQAAGELQVDLTTPERAARSVVVCLREEIRAIARHDDEAAKRCRDTLRTLADREEMAPQLTQQARLYGLTEDEAFEQIISRWGALINYYSEGLELERIECPPVSETTLQTPVLVPARGADDTAVIRVKCVRGEDELWRITAIGFQAERDVTRPASQPAP
jgi:hypothetical protein